MAHFMNDLYRLFSRLVSENQLDKVETMLASPEFAKSTCKQDFLNQAASLGNVAVLDSLVAKHGLNVNGKGYKGMTALHHAKDGATGTWLLAHGAVAQAKSEDGESPLHTAACREDDGLFEVLVANGAQLDEKTGNGQQATALLLALFNGSFENAEKLIKLGANVSIATNDTNETGLHATGLTIGAAKALIAKGANVNAVSSAGLTPLHCASWQSTPEVVKLLIDSGAKLDAKDSSGRTPISYALQTPECEDGECQESEDDEIDAEDYVLENIKVLIKHGANATIGNKDGQFVPIKCCN